MMITCMNIQYCKFIQYRSGWQPRAANNFRRGVVFLPNPRPGTPAKNLCDLTMFTSSFAPREAKPKVNSRCGRYLILLFVSRGLVMNKTFQTAIKGGVVALVIMLTTGCAAETLPCPPLRASSICSIPSAMGSCPTFQSPP